MTVYLKIQVNNPRLVQNVIDNLQENLGWINDVEVLAREDAPDSKFKELNESFGGKKLS